MLIVAILAGLCMMTASSAAGTIPAPLPIKAATEGLTEVERSTITGLLERQGLRELVRYLIYVSKGRYMKLDGAADVAKTATSTPLTTTATPTRQPRYQTLWGDEETMAYPTYNSFLETPYRRRPHAEQQEVDPWEAMAI